MTYAISSLVLSAALILAGCGGDVVVSAAGGAGGTGATGSKGPTDCPASAPAPGAPCNNALTCIYGTPECEQTFQCAAGQWTALAFECPPACPSTQPDSGSPCGEDGQTCSYPDSSCLSAGAEAMCNGGAWNITYYGPGCAATCPSTPPNEGSPCNSCCDGPCLYPIAPSCSIAAECQGNKWSVFDAPCPPPTPCTMYTDPVACDSDGACRWLMPAACPMGPELPIPGCYSNIECVDNVDCPPGQACLKWEIDPCWNKGCNACSATTYVCMYPPPP